MEGSARRAEPAYDVIGVGYNRFHRADPRIEQRLRHHLGTAARVLNIGAGTGSYEPADRAVVAVEPSSAMIAQRSAAAAPVVRATAEALPFRTGAFDGALAVLTIHHWADAMAGLAEVRRVTRGPIVVFTFDPVVHSEQWLIAEYLPSMAALDSHTMRPEAIANALGGGVVEVVPIPHDCVDGFCHAWWRRPAAYLDPAVRASISGIARLPTAAVDDAMRRLSDDLSGGAWQRAHADLLERTTLDVGHRIVVADPALGGP